MIKLTPAPTQEARRILDEAQRRYQELSAAGQEIPTSVLTAYRQPDVKAAIKAETCEKCIYCESRITHISYGDVEHILPKSRRPELMSDYNNLGFACTVCNNNKRDYYDEGAPLLNPYVDEPSEHLGAAGPMVVRLRGSRTAQVTEITIRLNRTELFDRRRDRLEAITALVDQYHRENPGGLKDALARELWREADRCAEYSMIVTGYLNTVAHVPRPTNAVPLHAGGT